MRKPLHITPFLAIEKLKNWCAYQERSQADARQKLFLLGITGEEAESIIITLIEENYLNEERFAFALARGKMRIKHWGKIKIKLALKKHGISENCIKLALKALDDEEYLQVLDKAIERKLNENKKGDKKKIYYSIVNNLLSKGFEKDLVIDRLNVLLNPES